MIRLKEVVVNFLIWHNASSSISNSWLHDDRKEALRFSLHCVRVQGISAQQPFRRSPLVQSQKSPMLRWETIYLISFANQKNQVAQSRFLHLQ
jgi:hypothetical protein